MSKIRVLIYRLDIYSLQTNVSFQDHEKLLEEVVFSLVVYMNTNTKNSQIKHCLCTRVKIYIFKYATIKNL